MDQSILNTFDVFCQIVFQIVMQVYILATYIYFIYLFLKIFTKKIKYLLFIYLAAQVLVGATLLLYARSFVMAFVI